VCEAVNRKLPARNTLVQLYVHQPWQPQCTALQTDRQTDGQHYDVNSRSRCVTIRLANNENSNVYNSYVEMSQDVYHCICELQAVYSNVTRTHKQTLNTTLPESIACNKEERKLQQKFTEDKWLEPHWRVMN